VLGIVIANADLLRPVLPASDADAHHDLDEVKRAAHRGAEMIRKLLGFSRQSSLEIVPLDLLPAVGEVVATLRRLLPSNITIRQTGAGSVAVRADRTALEQILLNLATNARDAMPAGGTLSVDVRTVTVEGSDGTAPGSYGCLTVRDTGQGMPEEVLARVYDPFFTTKPPAQGSGLGMAMVYGLVRQQEGTIRIESVPGAGTTVTVCLPVAGSVPERRDPARRSLPRGTETVLLVEDEAPLRNAAARILQRLGYTVLAAADGDEALALFDRDSAGVALVVSDIMMPRRNGHALYEALRATGRPVRFLFSSGYSGTPIEGLGDRPGAPPFLGKPWTAEELAMKVREVLDG
jgi:CheY-like chemotaxis protein